MIAIEKIMPLSKVEHGAILSANGDITLGYEVYLPELFTLSDKEYEAIHHSLIKAIRILQSGTLFYKQDWFTRAAYKGEYQKAGAGILALASERFFDKRLYFDHRSYIFLTRKAQNRRTSSSAYSGILRKSIVPEQTINPILFEQFLDNAAQFERIMNDGGSIQIRRLSDEQLAGSKRSAGVIERYCQLLPEGEREIRDVHIKDRLQIGDAHCRLMTLADADDLPSLCGSRVNYDAFSTDKTKFPVGFAAHLGLLLPCNHIYSQYVFLEDQQKRIKQLEAKKLRLQSLSAYSRENAMARDAVNDYLNEALGKQRLPVKAHFNVLAWSETETGIRELKHKVGSALARMDATPKEETDGAAQIWWAGIPGNSADFPMNDTFDTFLEQACCFLNLESNYRSSPLGIRFGERLYGMPVRVDLFDEPMKTGLITNRNMFVCGGSGGGKSMTMNHILRSLYEQGTHCVTVDIGGSYKGLCDLLGGYYFIYTEDNPIRFNPFYLSPGDMLDTEKKESLKNLLVALWKKEEEQFRRSEYVAISEALSLYYQHLDAHPEVFPCFDSFYDFLRKEYVAFMRSNHIRSREFDLENFLYVLKPYYGNGEFGYLLNARENLDLLNERFIVFELDNVKSHPILFPVVTLIIMEMFVSKMRKLKGQRKMLAIDEAWVAIAKSGMGNFIKYIYKTVRKFNGIVALITQEVDDLISSPVIKETVVNLSDTKILMDMSKFMNKFDKLQEVMGMSDKAKTLLLSINKANEPGKSYRELLIDQGGKVIKVYRNELSPEEYLVYSTEESEKLKVEQYTARYGSISKAIEVLAAEIRDRKH